MSDLVVSDRLTIPWAEIKVSFARSSGPGGQNVNKVESKVELRWIPGDSEALSALPDADRAWLLDRLAGRLTISGELLVTSQKTRDQTRNREDAADKLVEIIRAALTRPKSRKPTRMPRAIRERRIRNKKRRADVKRSRQAPSSDD